MLDEMFAEPLEDSTEDGGLEKGDNGHIIFQTEGVPVEMALLERRMMASKLES